jgi:hypothetical protein
MLGMLLPPPARDIVKEIAFPIPVHDFAFDYPGGPRGSPGTVCIRLPDQRPGVGIRHLTIPIPHPNV